MHPSTSVHDIKTLILSFHPIIAIETVEEERVHYLLRAVAADLQMPLFDWSLTHGLVRFPGDTSIYGTADPLQLLKHLESMTLEAIFLLKDFARHLDNPAVSRTLRDVVAAFSNTRKTLVLSGESVRFPLEIEPTVVYFRLQLPAPDELREVVLNVLRSLKEKNRIQVEFRSQDMEALLGALSGMTLNQARQVIAYAALEDGKFSPEDIARVLERKVQKIAETGLLEYFPAVDNKYELGGFATLKSWLQRARVGFGPEAREFNLTPPRGILIVGVQGCGKSLAAKIVAREWKLPLLKLDAARLYDKYIGESEKNLRKAISLAESMAPTVLWIDEIEKSMATGIGSDADSGLSRRMLGSFLTWMQEKKSAVFLVATANDIWILPPEFLRKGRFDEIFFVDLPDPAEREAIFKIHLKLRKQNWEDFDLERLTTATEGFSGAEIEQAVIASLYTALHDHRPLDTELLLKEIRSTIPLSVSRREDIERLRETARGRFVGVH